jgi:hypothetical protein
MGLNLSNHPIAQALDLDKDDVYQITGPLRQGMVLKKPLPLCTDEVECDEVYLVAGRQGKPDAVERWHGRRRRLKGQRGCGPLATEKPLIFGMIHRGGEVVLRMLDNV